MWYLATMPSKPVQVSIDADLLERIDRDPETRSAGRSAFIRAAVELYLDAKRRQAVETRVARAYEGQADSLLDEIAELVDRQSWPSE
jgi:metal-responsive CopG/Arc/MetJ family transcriptional regulator